MKTIDKVTFRKAVLSDSLRLSVLYRQVFIQTYDTEGVTIESANYITRQFTVERIEDKINKNPDSVFVAVYEDNLTGVAEIKFENECPVNNIKAPELSKLYVLDSFYGIGVGYGLLMEAEKIVIEKGEKEMWLSVYIWNERAIKFYERNQYKLIGTTFFEMEFNKYENKVFRKKF